MPTYKGHTSQKFKHFLRNNRLYSSPFKDIDLFFFLKREALHYSNENRGFYYLIQDTKMPQTYP